MNFFSLDHINSEQLQTQHNADQLKNQIKDYFQKMYKKNKIKKEKAVAQICKKALLDDQFEFFLRALMEKEEKDLHFPNTAGN